MALSVELVIAAFLLIVSITALISMKLKIPYTVILQFQLCLQPA